MISVKEILYHIEKSAEQTDKLFEVASSLTKKQRTILKSVCSENEISAFEKFGL